MKNTATDALPGLGWLPSDRIADGTAFREVEPGRWYGMEAGDPILGGGAGGDLKDLVLLEAVVEGAPLLGWNTRFRYAAVYDPPTRKWRGLGYFTRSLVLHPLDIDRLIRYRPSALDARRDLPAPAGSWYQTRAPGPRRVTFGTAPGDP